jgi:uncharacterized metal-binding protein
MPSGRTHDRITLWTLPWIGGLSYLLTRRGDLVLIVAGAFLFSGLMFGPDLDIYSIQYQRWGIFRWLWVPYRSLISHRSALSHGLFLGTALRLLYFFSLVILIGTIGLGIAQFFWGFAWNWQQFARQVVQFLQQQHREEAIALLVGLELGAMSHSVSDWLVSLYQSRRKKKGEKKGTSRK